MSGVADSTDEPKRPGRRSAKQKSELQSCCAELAALRQQLDETVARHAEALQESEGRYRSLIDLSPDGIAVYDEKGYIIFANRAVASLLGYTPEALVGKPISDLISQDSREIELKRLQTTLEVGSLQSFVEEKWIMSDGSTIEVELASVTVVYGGKPAVQTVVRDITERKIAERSLRESEERLELALMGAGLGSWDWNLTTGEQACDPLWVEMLGYSGEEIEPTIRAWMNLVHPHDVPEIGRAFKDHCDGQAEIYEVEHRLKTKSGTWKWILSRGKIVERDQWGSPLRMAGTHLDVTDRKRAQELLAHQAKELGQRLKELDCLYEISKVVENPDAKLDQILAEIVKVLPAAWRYPDAACARITLGEQEFASDGFRESPWHLRSEVEAEGRPVGIVEVRYLTEKPESDEGAFCREERQLIDAVAKRLGRIIERFKVQSALRESEERFRAIFESAVDCTLLKDRSLRFTLVNPAAERLLGIKASEILGHRSEDLFDRETAEHWNQLEQRVLAGESVEEERAVSIKGQLLTLHIMRVPLRDAQGTIIGLCSIMRNVTERRRLIREDHRTSEVDYPSFAMRNALQKARIASDTDSIILLQGESGSGKDYLARWIHDHSARAAGPFFAINCAAVAKELAESELFGHERGAFTGAAGQKKGLLELGEGGTILLNEIGELPLSLQAKLLAFLDTRSFLRVGGQKHVTVNARLIAATHRDLKQEVEEGGFLRPLYYRLCVFPIEAPPLRHRIEDLPYLVQDLLSGLASEIQLPVVPVIDNDHISALARYLWPGNVRELRNVLERSLILWQGGRLTLALPSGKEKLYPPPMDSPAHGNRPLEAIIDEAISSACQTALRQAGGNKTGAAQILGISRGALYRYLKRLEIESDDRTRQE